MIKLLMILSGASLYAVGESKSKWLKYLAGLPVGLIAAFFVPLPLAVLSILTVFLAVWGVPYGTSSPLTKWVGPVWSVVISGLALGVSLMPLLGWFALVSSLVSGFAFYITAKYDGKINEPWTGIIRGIGGFIGLLI